MTQQGEQDEQQALALRKQTDEEALARQAVIARIEREREALQLQLQQAEIRKQVVELEAQAEELCLARLQERLENYRDAAEWDRAAEQLEVARGLASNSHAVVQVGNGSTSDITRAFLLQDIIHEPQEKQAVSDTRAKSSKSPLGNQPKNAAGQPK